MLFIGLLLTHNDLKSTQSQPPAGYANQPPNPVNCTYCHACVASYDSTNFLLKWGLDTSSLAPLITGQTYIPGTKYYLRISATTPSATYGFELTTQDSSGSGTTVNNFARLNTSNTSIVTNAAGTFMGHKNANTNNEWTFTWTAPTVYKGAVTFYYAGNDGNGSDTEFGDQIYLMKKTLFPDLTSNVNNIEDHLTALNVFPSVFSQQINVAFEIKHHTRVEGQIINMSGQVVKTLISEDLNAGKFAQTYDLSSISQGIYLLKLKAGEAYSVTKIVKE
jgi:hypothetical protein